MHNRFRLAAFVAAVLLGFATTAVAAQQDTLGTIAQFHYNPGIAGRGVCILMTPATNQPSIPGSGYACLPTSTPLYREITAELLASFHAGTSCDVRYETAPADPSFGNQIMMIFCYPYTVP